MSKLLCNVLKISGGQMPPLDEIDQDTSASENLV